MYNISAIFSIRLCNLLSLQASVLIFRRCYTDNPLKATGKMCNITISHLLCHLIDFISAVI